MDIVKASQNLSRLDLQTTLDNLMINILWFRTSRLDYQKDIKRHKHSSYEFHFIIEGKCVVVLDDGEFEAKAGEFYLTGPGVYHEQRCLEGDYSLEYALNCDINIAEDISVEGNYILELFKNKPCQSFKDIHGCTDYFKKALEEAYFERFGFYNNIKNLACMIITTAARNMSEMDKIDHKVSLITKGQDYRFMEIQKYIEDNASMQITTEDIGKYMCLSSKQVRRIIKSSLGVTTKELIINIKMQKSKELLKNTKLSIKEIAEQLGFSSEYYFSQFFKRIESWSPSEFRKNSY
jgi:AraC-like DNA-binding protein